MVSIYGIDKILKKYSAFPSFLPIEVMCQHGVNCLSYLNHYELETDKKMAFVVNQREKDVWQENSKIPVEIFGYHLLMYKKYKNIKQNADAKGTLVIPFHSTENFYADFDLKEYVQEVLQLPKKYHPITICLHNDDILHWKKDKELSDLDVKVVSAGSKYSYYFNRNVYDIYKRHKYVTSNAIGSGMFVATDLGLPFFFSGKIAKLNKINKDIKIFDDEFVETKDEYSTFIRNHFSHEPVDYITDKQKEFADEMLGKKHIMPPFKMNLILWREYIKKHKFGVFKDFYKRWNSKRVYKNKLNNVRKKVGNSSVYLFGAGDFVWFLLGVDNLEDLNIKGIIDSNDYIHGWNILDYKIYAIEEIKKNKPDYLFISVLKDKEIIPYLEDKIKEYNLDTKIIPSVFEGEYWYQD